MSILEQLIRLGAEPDWVSDHGESPLGVLLTLGDFAAMRILLRHGANSDVLQWTPLHHAVAFGTLDEVHSLATSPETINASGNCGQVSPWLLGFLRGDLAKTRFLAERGADLTQTDRFGQTPLHLAARSGNAELVSWWLGFGPDVHAADGPHRHTALDLAVEHNHLEAARVLLDGGASAIRDTDRDTQPIHLAKTVEMIRLLTESGSADVNAIDGVGDWPLKCAAEDNDVERIRSLLELGASVDLTSTGETALHSAVRADAREAVSLLLEEGANPNAQDVDGWTPLFEARSCETIRTLLDAGADPALRDQANFGVGRRLKDPLLLRALRRV
jgi:ankyrin repeat protein